MREEQKCLSASKGGVTTITAITTVTLAEAITTIVKGLWLSSDVN